MVWGGEIEREGLLARTQSLQGEGEVDKHGVEGHVSEVEAKVGRKSVERRERERERERVVDVDVRLVESQRRLKDALDASRASRAFANDLAREMSVCEAKLMTGLDERRELRDELESARKEIMSLTKALERIGGSHAVTNAKELAKTGHKIALMQGATTGDARDGCVGNKHRPGHVHEQENGHERGRQLSSLSAMALLSPIALAKSPSSNLALHLGSSNAGIDFQRVFSALASSRWWYKANLIIVR